MQFPNEQVKCHVMSQGSSINVNVCCWKDLNKKYNIKERTVATTKKNNAQLYACKFQVTTRALNNHFFLLLLPQLCCTTMSLGLWPLLHTIKLATISMIKASHFAVFFPQLLWHSVKVLCFFFHLCPFNHLCLCHVVFFCCLLFLLPVFLLGN